MTSIAPISGVTPTRPARSAGPNGAPLAARSAGAAPLSATLFAPGPRASGKSTSVRERFDTLEERFLPEKAKGVNVKLQFKLSGSGGGEWYVVVKDGKCTVTKGTGPNPTATLKASAKDYKKIADGEMNKMLAFLRGKLKIDGDKDALKPFDTWFKKP